MKYLKFRSMTWWIGAMQVGAGVFIAAEPIHGLADIAEFVSSLLGGVKPAILIGGGLGLIGLRAAPGLK